MSLFWVASKSQIKTAVGRDKINMVSFILFVVKKQQGNIK